MHQVTACGVGRPSSVGHDSAVMPISAAVIKICILVYKMVPVLFY